MVIESAVAGYIVDNAKQAPSNKDGGLNILIDTGYLEEIPKDPWGNKYYYSYPGTYSFMDVWSLGPDGVESDDDIVSWDRYGNIKRIKGYK